MNTLPTREEIKWWGKGIVWDIFLDQHVSIGDVISTQVGKGSCVIG